MLATPGFRPFKPRGAGGWPETLAGSGTRELDPGTLTVSEPTSSNGTPAKVAELADALA